MSDTSGSGFGKFVPGFEFLQNLAGQAAGGIGEGISKNIPQLPNLGHWVAPTVNVEDLEKRIEELKAVHFWLDQNSKALGATIQALEVQKMTLATLQTMNFSFGDVANALKLKAHDTLASFSGAVPEAEAPAQPNPFPGLEIPPRTYSMPAVPQAAAAPAAPVKKPAARKQANKPIHSAPQGGVVDPVQWWSALTDQFQAIATNAMKDAAKQSALETTRQVASGLTGAAVKTATGVAGKVGRNLTGSVARNVGLAAGAGKAVSSRARSAVAKKAKPAAKAPAAARRPSGGLAAAEWPMPGSFFPSVPGFTAAPAPAAKPARKPAKKTSAKPAARKTAAKKARAPARRR